MTYTFLGKKFNNPIITAPCPKAWTAEDLIALANTKASIITTKSVTKLPRKGNQTPREHYANWGSVNAVGLANDGIEKHVEYVKEAYKAINKPFIFSIAGFQPSDYAFCAEKASIPEVFALEINLSCPNVHVGELIIDNIDLVLDVLMEVKAKTNKPLGIKVNPLLPATQKQKLITLFKAQNIAYLVCTNTLGGIKALTPEGTPVLKANNGYGGLAGDALFQIALSEMKIWQELCHKNNYFPDFVGLGGINTPKRAKTYLNAGANMAGVATFVMKNDINDLNNWFKS